MAVRSAPSERERARHETRREQRVTNFLCVPGLGLEIYGIEFSAPRVYKHLSHRSSKNKNSITQQWQVHFRVKYGDACSITYNMNSMRTM